MDPLKTSSYNMLVKKILPCDVNFKYADLYKWFLLSVPEELNEIPRDKLSPMGSSFPNKIKDSYEIILIYWKSISFSTAYFGKKDTNDLKAIEPLLL